MRKSLMSLGYVLIIVGFAFAALGNNRTNQLPLAVADADAEEVVERTMVALDGSGSTDEDGILVAFTWMQIDNSAPLVHIQAANMAVASFTAPRVDTPTTFSFQLVVTDDRGATDADQVDVAVLPPAEAILNGAIRFLRVVANSAGNGLPRNEAAATELSTCNCDTLSNCNFNPNSNFFVPAQLGNLITVAVLSNALQKQDASFVVGYDDAGLLSYLSAAISSLEEILSTDSSVFPNSQVGRALFQAYDTTTAMPLNTRFGRIVSLLDNAILVAGLRAASSYIDDLDGMLASRIDDLISQFDFTLWLVGSDFRLGGFEDPRLGSLVDRIISESRLAPVTARALGQISAEQFANIVQCTITSSVSTTTPAGITIERLPKFGRALEIWAATPFLSDELQTRLGTCSIIPLADAWFETMMNLNLPAAGATPVADGFGNFLEFELSPAEEPDEGPDDLQDTQVLVPPAAGILAGALGTQEVFENLRAMVAAVVDDQLYDPKWGVPNALDRGTGLINEADPVRGTLEIAMMAVALLNRRLGGDFLTDLLKEDPIWAQALQEYVNLVNTLFVEGENAANIEDEFLRSRSEAIGDETLLLPSVGSQADFEVVFKVPGDYGLVVRYSNDDTGVGDTVTVLLDGEVVQSFTTQDTDGYDPMGMIDGWNIFVNSPEIVLGEVPTGTSTLSLRLDTSDGFGVEIDSIAVSIPER